MEGYKFQDSNFGVNDNTIFFLIFCAESWPKFKQV
jgi:hypothetical protein